MDRHDCEQGCLASATPTSPTPGPTPGPSPASNSCKGCLDDNSANWKETCAFSRCAGCKGCPTQTKCENWCSAVPSHVKWAEKCDWIYCEGCNECNAATPTSAPTRR